MCCIYTYYKHSVPFHFEGVALRGLKPVTFENLDGTTEVVPFPTRLPI